MYINKLEEDRLPQQTPNCPPTQPALAQKNSSPRTPERNANSTGPQATDNPALVLPEQILTQRNHYMYIHI